MNNTQKKVTTYLALMIDRQVDYNSTLCSWGVDGEYVRSTFGRQTLAMVWDYFELCPWSNATGDWNSALKWTTMVIEHLSNINYNSKAVISQFSATSLPYKD
jgi:putative DNA methylase